MARSSVTTASIADSLSIVAGVIGPTIAKGVIVRRPKVVGVAERLDLDGGAVRRMQKLRRRYGDGPLRVRMPGPPRVILLSQRDLKRVLADAEALLVATADDTGEEVTRLRSRVTATLSQAKTGLIEAQAAVVDKAKVAAKATDEYVHDNPWKSIGIAAGVGLLVGAIIGRR